MTGVQKHFVTIEGGQVHYLRSGEGHPIILLHPLVGDATSMEELSVALGEQFCCIAPDLPGFGHSDPLEEGGDLSTMAEIIPLLVEKLSLEKPHLYGIGLGAIVGAILSDEYRDLFSDIILDQYPFHDAVDAPTSERSEEPLLALWQSLRNYHVDTLTRGQKRLDLDAIQKDFLALSAQSQAFEDIRKAVRDFDGLEQLINVKAPVCFLAATADDLPSLPQGLTSEIPENTADFLLSTLAQTTETPPKPGETEPLPSPFMTKDYVVVGERRIAQQYRLADHEAVVLSLHELGLSSEAFNDIFTELNPDFNLLCPDIPQVITSLDSYRKFLADYLKALPEETIILARDASAGLVLAALSEIEQQPRGIILDQPVAAPDGMAEDIANFMAFDTKPQPYGEHILHALGRMRDRGQYWPWHMHDSDHVMRDERQLDTTLIQERATKALANPHYAEQLYLALSQPIFELAEKVTCPIVFLADSRIPQADDIKRLSRSTKFGLYIELTGAEGVEAGMAALGY